MANIPNGLPMLSQTKEYSNGLENISLGDWPMPNPTKIPPCDLTRQYSAISQPNPMNMPNISPDDLPMPNPHTTSHPVIGQCQTPKKIPPCDSPSSKLQWKISQIATFHNPKEKLTW